MSIDKQVLGEDIQDIAELKADHSGGDVVKGSESAEPVAKNAEDPKADGKKKKGADKEADKSATKVDMKVESSTPSTKSGMINAALDAMKGKSKADLAATFEALMGSMDPIVEAEEEDDEAPVDAEVDSDDEDEDDKDATESKKVTKEDIDISDAVAALVEGQDLSEDFKDKATMIFESAVVSKVNDKLADIAESAEEAASAAQESLAEEMSEKVDSYLEYVVEEWVKENQLAIDSGIRNELAEDFVNGLKGLFESHYIDVPEDKVNVIEEMTARLEELESQLNESVDSRIGLSKEVESFKAESIFANVTEGLVATQVEKLRSLAESVDFETEEDYTERLSTLKESYFPKDGDAKPVSLTEEVSDESLDLQEESGPMAGYVKALSRTVKQ